MTAPEARPRETPRHAVGRAIQDLTARRLGRAFVPLTLLFLVGVGELGFAWGRRGLVPVLGAPAAAGAMLAYGLRGVQIAFGRAPRPWMALAGIAGVLPVALGLYAAAWRGLRILATARGLQWSSLALAALFTLLGAWLLYAWWRILEVQGLARAMVHPLPGEETDTR